MHKRSMAFAILTIVLLSSARGYAQRSAYPSVVKSLWVGDPLSVLVALDQTLHWPSPSHVFGDSTLFFSAIRVDDLSTPFSLLVRIRKDSIAMFGFTEATMLMAPPPGEKRPPHSDDDYKMLVRGITGFFGKPTTASHDEKSAGDSRSIWIRAEGTYIASFDRRNGISYIATASH